MFSKVNLRNPIQPLSLGNVVTAAVLLYNSNLKSYLLLALFSCLWIMLPLLFILLTAFIQNISGNNISLIWAIIIPITIPLYLYCCAKYFVNAATISRLSFGYLINQPEDVKSAGNLLNSRLWQFLLMFLLMVIILLGLFIFLCILYIIYAFQNFSLRSTIIRSNYLFLGFIVILVVIALWFTAKIFIIEVPLAIEDKIYGTSTISRSWELTKGNVWRIVAIIIVTYLLTLPIQSLFSVVSLILQRLVFRFTKLQNISEVLLLGNLINLTINLISLTITLPFWQAIKATIYYDLRSRREGFGLRLRDHEI